MPERTEYTQSGTAGVRVRRETVPPIAGQPAQTLYEIVDVNWRRCREHTLAWEAPGIASGMTDWPEGADGWRVTLEIIADCICASREVTL